MAQTRRVEIGVVVDGSRDIPVTPTISDIGVPVEGLREADNVPQLNTHQRTDIDPQARTISSRGIGVPFNPNNGVTST